MLGDHWPLILLVLLVALVIFGPKRLPELGHSLGRALSEFRHASQSVVDDTKAAAGAQVDGAPAGGTPGQPGSDHPVGAAPGSSDRAG